MGEGIIIGTVIVLSGLVLAIIKKSQGSSLPSEVDKKAYQTKLEDKLLHHYAANEAHWISKNLSDFIFDFGLDLQHDALVARYQDHAHLEKDRLYTQRIVSPNQLCEQLVGRAIDLKINPARFVGPFTRSDWQVSASHSWATRWSGSLLWHPYGHDFFRD